MDDTTQVIPKITDNTSWPTADVVTAEIAKITRRQPHLVHVRTVITVDNDEIIFDASASGDIDTGEAMHWLRRTVNDVVEEWIEARGQGPRER